MTGELFIDSLDAFTRFGVSLARGAFARVVEYAPLKAPKTNNWHEYDGVEVDLSNPKLDTRTLTIPFICEESPLTGSMLALLSDGGYHSFTFSNLNKTLNLRLVSQTSRNTLRFMQSFELEFADDYPLEGYTYVEPVMSGVSDGFNLDNRDFSHYGIRVLEGSMDEVRKSPAVKQNKLINLEGRQGIIYDGSTVTFEPKDVTLHLLMQTSDVDEFWANYNAFLYDLTRVGERSLFIDETSGTYPCYYKSARVEEMTVMPDGKVWCEFDITLVFTSFRCGEAIYLLATESGAFVTGQTGFLIDLMSNERDS